MWKLKYAWPFYVTVLLSVVGWGEGIYFSLNKELFLFPRTFSQIFLPIFLFFFTPIWSCFLCIFYLRLNRFYQDHFKGIVTLICCIPFFCLAAFLTQSIFLIQVFILFILPITSALVYASRYYHKSPKLPFDALKLILIIAPLVVTSILLTFFEKQMDYFSDFGGFLIAAFINLLFLIALALNLYHLHLRRLSPPLNQLIDEIGQNP